MTREEVIASALRLGVDMSEWEEPRIQQIVDIVNTPPTLPPSKLIQPRWPLGVFQAVQW